LADKPGFAAISREVLQNFTRPSRFEHLAQGQSACICILRRVLGYAVYRSWIAVKSAREAGNLV
jgi:hypothetical protein